MGEQNVSLLRSASSNNLSINRLSVERGPAPSWSPAAPRSRTAGRQQLTGTRRVLSASPAGLDLPLIKSGAQNRAEPPESSQSRTRAPLPARRQRRLFSFFLLQSAGGCAKTHHGYHPQLPGKCAPFSDSVTSYPRASGKRRNVCFFPPPRARLSFSLLRLLLLQSMCLCDLSFCSVSLPPPPLLK